MTYEAFKRELCRNVLQQAGTGRLIKLLEKGNVCRDEHFLRAVRIMNLNAGRAEDGKISEDVLFVLREGPGQASAMHWSVRPLYESYKKEGWQGVLPAIVMKLQKGDRPGQEASDYGRSLERLMIRPLNLFYNRGELEDCVYWSFGDIALVLYVLLYESEKDIMSMKVNRSLLGKWGVTRETVLTDGLLNTYAKMPPRLYLGTDMRACHSFGEGAFMEECGGIKLHPEDAQEGLRGYRLTTSRWLNGGVALFYPGVRERIGRLLGEDYYVGFTSIHEAVLHPVRHKALGEMKAAIQHTNAVFDRREMLSDKVYRFCLARQELIEV